MATKKSNTKTNLLPGHLLQGKPILTNVALAFAVVFAAVGGYFIHSTGFAAALPEIQSNLSGGFCLDDWNGTLGVAKPGGAADVKLYKCVQDTNQHFTFYGNQIRLNGLAQCLDVQGQSKANGATVDLYPCVSGQTNQQWTYSNGEIIGKGSGKCLDVPGGNAYNGQRIEIYACNGGTNQKWNFGTSLSSGSGNGWNCKGAAGNGYDTAPASYCNDAAYWVDYYGWKGSNTQSQLTCASSIFNHESGWRVTAQNASGAYGIPQALPGSKMSSAGADWATNPNTQIHWGISYMKGKYTSPCGAWSFWQRNNYY